MSTIEFLRQIAIVNEIIICNIPYAPVQANQCSLDSDKLVLLRKVPANVDL